MENEDQLSPFSLPSADAHPADIAERIKRYPEHLHLAENEVSIGYLMRNTPKEKGNKVELGSVHTVKTMFQGGFKDLGLQLLAEMLGDLPDFLVVINAPWWEQATPLQREALLSHELCHVQQALDSYGAPKFDRDGLPVFKVVEHDVAAFRSEVERFGLWTNDLRAFVAAAKEA